MQFDGIQGFGGGGPVPGMDPNAYAQRYADENGITLEEAKAQLRAKHGDPQQPNQASKDPMSMNGSAWGAVPGFGGLGGLRQSPSLAGMNGMETPRGDDSSKKQELLNRGIPQYIIDKGDDAIRKFAEENGINLPPRQEIPEDPFIKKMTTKPKLQKDNNCRYCLLSKIH